MNRIKPLLIITMLLFISSVNLSAQGYKLPPYQKFQLPNGLTIYLMEQHEVPLISVSAILPAGAIYDGEKAGLASLTATALQHGTKSYSKEKLDAGASLVQIWTGFIYKGPGIVKQICKAL